MNLTYPYKNLDTYTLPTLFDRSINLYANNDVLGNVNSKAMTYKELDKAVKDMVKLLKNDGIVKGDKVALLSENMPNWAVAYFSVTYIGAVIVPILPDFHHSDVHHILRHSKTKAVFVSHKYETVIEECQNSAIEIVINLNELKIVEKLSNPSYLSQIKHKMNDTITKTEDIADTISDTINKTLNKETNKNTSKPKEDDIAALIYTSGTTGNSKGVMLSHKNLVTNAMSSFSVLEVLPEDVFLSILPLAHTYECTVGLILPILHGSSVRYINKAPTPSVLQKAFAIVRPTMMLSVPLVMEKIYKNRVLSKFNGFFITKFLYQIPFFRKILNQIAGKKLMETFGGRIKFFGIGGAALSPFIEQFLYEAKFPYVIGYGLTETAPLLAGTPVNMPKKLGSTGPAMYGVQLKIKDKNDLSGKGEICAKSPSIMLGYYKNKEQTDEVFDEDGWFLTGDLGHIDEDGYLFISGRSKSVIIGSGGENIYPEQIESIINQNETVLDSLVLGQEGKVIARIHLDYDLIDKMFKANNTPDGEVKEKIIQLLEDIRFNVNTKVASYAKIIKVIEQIEPFVKTPTKKIKRYLYTN